jgi:hypothetical protein
LQIHQIIISIAFDFPAAVALFVADGALKLPFQEPIVGHDSILDYMHAECYGLKLLPEQGVSESADGGFTQIKVTGKVQTPWFGDSVGINLAWRQFMNCPYFQFISIPPLFTNFEDF